MEINSIPRINSIKYTFRNLIKNLEEYAKYLDFLEKNLTFEKITQLFPEYNKQDWNDPEKIYNYFWNCFHNENDNFPVWFLNKIKDMEGCEKRLFTWFQKENISETSISESDRSLLLLLFVYSYRCESLSEMRKKQSDEIAQNLKKNIDFVIEDMYKKGYFKFILL